MIPDSKLRKLHARVAFRRRAASHEFFLEDNDFRFAAECERMRVDRNGSVLSLLLVKLKSANPEDVGFFARLLEGRLRVTDTPGMLNDGRVGILLPDTPAEGAWKVATDISEVFPPGPGRPECEVRVYPEKDRHRESEEVDETAPTPSSSNESQSSTDFFFVKALPWWKRGIDLLGAGAGLVVSFPILLVAAVAIRLSSSGPAFFSQEREGYGGKKFRMYKLRTMSVDAEERQGELRQYSQQDGPAFKMRRDPRTTVVGRFLRWSSLDELPQFLNVLKGDMSLVGPRPLPTRESRACENWQRRRLSVMPGMTCSWQVCERGNVRFDEWMRMDLRYVRKLNFKEDLRLLLVTLPSLVIQKGMR